jgi:hypothetical protein
MNQKLIIQAALVIRGLFVCGFTYSHLKNDLKWQFFLSKMDFLYANSRFQIQNDGTYLQRISRETCTTIWTLKTYYLQYYKITENRNFIHVKKYYFGLRNLFFKSNKIDLVVFFRGSYNQKRMKLFTTW